MKYNLIDEMGTRYLYKSWGVKIANFLSSLDDKDVTEIDLAGARITPDISDLIDSYMLKKNIRFVDTEDSNRQKILTYNYQLSNLSLQQSEILPKDFKITEFMNYIKSLDVEKIYTIPVVDKGLYIPLAAAILLIRPKLMLDLTESITDVMSLICKSLYTKDVEELVKTDNKFMYLYKGNFIEFESNIKEDNKFFYVYGVGKVTWSMLIERYYVVPSYFGKVNVFSDERYASVWKPVLDEIKKELVNYTQTKKVNLVNFLKGEY